MISRRNFLKDECFSHYRVFPVGKEEVALVTVALENLVIYKSLYSSEIYDRLTLRIMESILCLCESDTSLSQSAQYYFKILNQAFGSQNVKIMDELLQNQNFFNFLTQVTNPLSRSNEHRIHKTCLLFNIDLIYNKQSQTLRFRKNHGINVFMVTKDSTSQVFYYKVSTYCSNHLSRNGSDYENIQVFSCLHSSIDGSNRCNCKKYHIENTKILCHHCKHDTHLHIVNDKILCKDCIVEVIYKESFSQYLALELKTVQKLFLIKSVIEKNYEFRFREICVLCLKTISKGCKCLCKKCFKIHNPKDSQICNFCKSAKINKKKHFIKCFRCPNAISPKEFTLEFQENVVFCTQCSLEIYMNNKITIRNTSYNINLKNKTRSLRLLKEKFKLDIQPFIFCNTCHRKDNMICYCECSYCVTKIESKRCYKCDKTYTKEFLCHMIDQDKRFCDYCLENEQDNLLVLNNFKICKECCIQHIHCNTKILPIQKFEVKGTFNKSIVLKKNEVPIDQSLLFKIAERFNDINWSFCINCYRQKSNGCFCMCFNCSIRKAKKQCAHCKQNITYLREKIVKQHIYFCKCMKFSGDFIRIEDIDICIQCLKTDYSVGIDTYNSHVLTKIKFLGNHNKNSLRGKLNNKDPNILKIRCSVCKGFKEVGCCSTCQECIISNWNCPDCNGFTCSVCKRKNERACNCTCQECVIEYKTNSCLNCLQRNSEIKCKKCQKHPQIEFGNLKICCNCAYNIIDEHHRKLNLKVFPKAYPNLGFLVKQLKQLNYPTSKQYLCRKCHRFTKLRCNCICWECTRKRDKECRYCSESIVVSSPDIGDTIARCRRCGNYFDESFCANKCECRDCVTGMFLRNEINSSCRICMFPYDFQSLKSNCQQLQCAFCQKMYVDKYFFFSECCSFSLCYGCAREYSIELVNPCEKCNRKIALKQLRNNLIDCCMKFVADEITICYCPLKHYVHRNCLPPCQAANS